MKLTTLHLERFGARSNLQLDQLSEHLNVVYGPNGSGKTTLIHFLRWVLYGDQDPASRRYVAGDNLRAGGSVTLRDGQHELRVVSRHDDGTSRGRVRVDDASGSSLAGYDPGRLTGIQFNEYCHTFSLEFDQPPAIDELARLAAMRGLELTYDERQLRQLQQADERRTALQEQLQRLSVGELSLTALQDRYRHVQAEIDAAERRRSQRLQEIDQACQQLTDQQQEQQNQQADLDAIWRRTEQNIELRQRQLEEAAQEAAQLRQQWLEQRRQQVAEIDYQIQQWHHVLDTLRQRQENLQACQPSREPQVAAPGVQTDADLRGLLGTLGYQIDDVEQDLQDLPSVDRAGDQRVQTDYLRSVLGTALHSMRADVQRLYHELQQQRSVSLYHDHARELAHLRRCELELNDLIDVLSRRRQTLISDEVVPSYLETVGVRQNGQHNGDGLSEPPLYNVEGPTDLDRSIPQGQWLTDPVLQARLGYLLRRRDYVAERIREIAHNIEATQHRLETLRASREHLEEDRQLQSLRQQLADIDQQLRRLDEWQHVRREIESLEREVEQLRDSLQPSQIVQEASSILRTLTDHALVRLRIPERKEVWVEDQRGSTVRFDELSRGTRDQVYLSLCLALISAYRQRGIEMPLILNDLFVNIDHERAQATANLLSQFAGRGFQILLFTRHEHIWQLFPDRGAKRYTLRERARSSEPIARRPATETVPPTHRTPRVEAYYLDQASTAWIPSADVPRPAPAAEPPGRRPLRRESHHDWVGHWDPPRRSPPPQTAREEITTVEPQRPTPHEETPLTQLPSLDPQAVNWLQEIGVENVRQLLELDPDEAQRRLARSGVTAATVYRWQSELSLQCHVGLSPSDASLLVACGVDDPEELSYIDVTELHRRIEQYLGTSELRGRYGAISRFERSRLARWIEAARRSRFRRYRTRGNGAEISPASWSPRTTYRQSMGEHREPVVRRADPPQPASADPVAAASPVVTSAPPEETLRFFLELSDPLVDAPSIGPKTAERFHAVGLLTVADLLDADASQAAEQINYRRITAALIGEWQRQTQMVCRIPNLRGHDAQILVACGVTSPDQLAAADPAELLGRVQRFVPTSEGKRILRNSPAPDLEEVTAWVRWAQKARPLRVE